MSEIKVPEAMLKAACNTGWPTKREEVEAVIESALRWLSENPIEPTEDQLGDIFNWAEENGHYSNSKTATYIGVEVFCEWQRRMFLAPGDKNDIE